MPKSRIRGSNFDDDNCKRVKDFNLRYATGMCSSLIEMVHRPSQKCFGSEDLTSSRITILSHSKDTHQRLCIKERRSTNTRWVLRRKELIITCGGTVL